MTDTRFGGIPEAVRRMMALAGAQRRGYAASLDPVPVAPAAARPALPPLSEKELLELCAREPETDMGNANRLMIRFGKLILHITHVGWAGYTGTHWKEDASGAVVRVFAHRTAKAIDDEAIALDCSADERKAIDAGREALAKLREMGKPPSVSADVDDARLAELDGLIAAAREAENARIRLGPAKADSPDEHLAELQRLKAAMKLGREAERERRKMLDATSSWSPEQYAEHARLEGLVAAMDSVQRDRDGRMSSRHGHAKSAAGTTKINNMLTEAIPYVSKEVNDMNTDLYAVNCRTGTLRFFCEETDGKRVWRVRLDPHRPEDFISKIADVDFDPDAGAFLFDQFLQRVMPNPDYRAFLQRYMGYVLLGLTVEQCLLFFYGAGRNGKSTFVDLMVEVLGDYAVSMSIDSFAGDSRRAGAEATPDLARLPGARLVAASEPEMGVHLKDALIKALTGGEPIAVRRLHQDFFELVPQFKIILSGNHKPVIRDDSDGIWRRVHLVPWDIQIPEADVDRDLPRKLRREKAGVFAWMVRGALDYLQRGLQVPAGVKAATADYREESDTIGAFIRHACDVTGAASDRLSPKELYDAFIRYAQREGLPELRQATFTRRLPDQTAKSFMGPDGTMRRFIRTRSHVTLYTGIRIHPDFACDLYGGGPFPQYP